MLNWQQLIENAPLGHKARNTRAALLLQDLVQGHTANSHGVAGASTDQDQNANQAAWRFLDNDNLTLPGLYQPVHAALQQRRFSIVSSSQRSADNGGRWGKQQCAGPFVESGTATIG